MTAAELEDARVAIPGCVGLALFTGTPPELAIAAGAPARAGLAEWGNVAEAVPALLHEGPVMTSEVLVRAPDALLLLAERPGGVVAVVIELARAGLGVALVQARVAAAKVGG